MRCRFYNFETSDNLEWYRTSSVKKILIGFCIFASLCTSPVWSGFACLENPCFHGICIDYLDINSTHQCYCRNGFTGYSCQINWDECRSNPCLNGGICSDGIASFNCSCPDNFAGTFCEYDLSACDEIFPCQNNGTCTIDPYSSNGTFMCVCPAGFLGPQCESDVSICNITENVCRNGGRCIDGLGVNFRCECESGWSGSTCEIDFDECESQPCQNGGICVNKINDYSCACPFGYTGKACESKLQICEVNPCKNGAFCLHEAEDDAKLTCYCVPDYHGTLCEYKYDDCDPSPKCYNGGSCIDGVGDFTCSCPPEYFGPTCQCTLDNLTHPECQFNETFVPGFSEIPFSVSTKLVFDKTPIAITSNYISRSVFPQPEESILPDKTLSLSSSIQGEELVSRQNILSSIFIPTTPSMTLSLELPISKTMPLSPAESTESYLPQLSPLYPSPKSTIQIESSLVESETLYEPCPTLSIEGSEGLLLPPSMSLLISSNVSQQDVHSLVTYIVKSEQASSIADVEASHYLTAEYQRTASITDKLSGIIINSIKPSQPIETLQTMDVPEQDIINGFSTFKPPFESIQSSMYPVSSLIYSDELSELSPSFKSEMFEIERTISLGTLLFSLTGSESVVSLQLTPEISTLKIDETPVSPFTLDFSVPSSFSPTTTPFSLLSPFQSELLSLSPTKINVLPSLMEPEVSAVTFTPVLQSDLVTTMRPHKPDEALLNASRLSDYILTSQFITASVPGDTSLYASLLKRTTSLYQPSITKLVTSSTFQQTPVTESEYLISSSPSKSQFYITPEPTITLSTPTITTEIETSSDFCLDYCQNNAKCVSTSIQPVCLCSFKFIGERCETPRKKFTTTSFTGDSFLGYRVPNESINRIVVLMKLATNFPEGILFYTSVEKLYALIFIQSGHVTLHFSCGEQSMHFVETRTRVDNGKNFTVEFSMELIVRGINELHCVGQVNVNQSFIMRGEQILSLNGPHENPIQMVYLGGVGSTNAIKNDELIGIIPGFRGCLYSLLINQEEKNLFDDAVDGQEVSDCSTFECSTNPCFGKSKCVPFNHFPFWQCVCPSGFKGVRCQIRFCDIDNPCQNGATCTFHIDDLSDTTSSSALVSNQQLFPSPICLCPMGFSGFLCQSKINITKPSFKPTLGFDYSAFIAYESIPHFVDWVQLKFHFVTRNITQIALLVYSGFQQGITSDQSSVDQLEIFPDILKESPPESHLADTFEIMSDPAQRTSDFFSITFVHGYIALTWNLGSGTQRIITPSRIDKRLNVHTLFAGRSGRQAWLKVDGMRNITGKSPGPFHRLNVNTELFVGGYEAFRFEGLPHDLPLHKGFEGCIFDFGFRVKNRLYLPRATRGRNIQNCYEEDC